MDITYDKAYSAGIIALVSVSGCFIIFQQMPNALGWKIYIKCLQIIYIGWHKLFKKKKKIKVETFVNEISKITIRCQMRERKIQKSILRPLLMAESWFLCQNICCGGWKIYI